MKSLLFAPLLLLCQPLLSTVVGEITETVSAAVPTQTCPAAPANPAPAQKKNSPPAAPAPRHKSPPPRQLFM